MNRYWDRHYYIGQYFYLIFNETIQIEKKYWNYRNHDVVVQDLRNRK